MAKLPSGQCIVPPKSRNLHDFGELDQMVTSEGASPLPSTRDVWCINRAGSLDRLTRATEPLPPPGPGEARIRVEAIGVNFADVFACLGLYSATPSGPFVPGLEAAGVVEAVGPPSAGVAAPANVRVGDRVMALTRFGSYTTALNHDVRYLRVVPDRWSLADGAAFPAQAITAWYGLVALGRIARNEVVLVHSAAGGVGLHALDLARAAGASVVATVGSDAKRDWLVAGQRLDPDAIIVRDRHAFAAQLRHALAAIGQTSVDIVFDAVMGPYFQPAWERLRSEGRYIVYGAADFMTPGPRPNWLTLAWRWLGRPRLDPLQTIAENRTLSGFNLIWMWDRIDRLPAAYDAVLAGAHAPPHIGARFRFADAPDALRALQSGTTVGKVIIDVGH